MKLKGTILEIEREGDVFSAILKVAFLPESEVDVERMASVGPGDEIELPEFDVTPSDGDDAVEHRLN